MCLNILSLTHFYQILNTEVSTVKIEPKSQQKFFFISTNKVNIPENLELLNNFLKIPIRSQQHKNIISITTFTNTINMQYCKIFTNRFIP